MVEAGGQNEWSYVRRERMSQFNLMHLPCLNALLPQPFIHTSTCLLHLLWAPPGYLTQLSGRLSVLWLAGNLAISLFLAQLDSHLSFSSLRLSAVTMGLWNLCTKSVEGLNT